MAAFLETYSCPEPLRVSAYIDAADHHGLDYRILPAISLLESTCGKSQRHNNQWGWNNAVTGFPSVEEGIDYVTGRLSQSPLYEGKNLDEMLFTYNPDRDYVQNVKRLMLEIDEERQGLAGVELIAFR